jgi:flagellar assembly protein FliH
MPRVEVVEMSEPLVGAVLIPSLSAARAADARSRAKYQEGYAAGLREGEERLRQQLLEQRQELLHARDGILRSLEQCQEEMKAACEAAMIDLALETANRLVSARPLTREEVAAGIAEALRRAPEGSGISVQLHPDDLALLQEKPAAESGSLDERFPGLRVEVSMEVSRGGCIVQTNLGYLDARRETRFERLKRCLREP